MLYKEEENVDVSIYSWFLSLRRNLTEFYCGHYFSKQRTLRGERWKERWRDNEGWRKMVKFARYSWEHRKHLHYFTPRNTRRRIAGREPGILTVTLTSGDLFALLSQTVSGSRRKLKPRGETGTSGSNNDSQDNMTTLISEHDVVDNGSKWRICRDIELRDITWGMSLGESTGPGGQDRGQGDSGKGGDASYDILPPEVPGSASGSVPAGYCPAAWSWSSCRSTWWSMTGSTRRSASSAAVTAQGPPTPAAGSGWGKVAAVVPAAPPAPAEAARPRQRPETAASSWSPSSSSSSSSLPPACRARPSSTRGTTSTAASSTARPRRPPGASCPGCASSRRCSRDSSRWWRPYCSPDPAREPRRSCSCRARSLGWSSFSAWSWTRAAFDPALVVVYRDAQCIIDRVNREEGGRLATVRPVVRGRSAGIESGDTRRSLYADFNRTRKYFPCDIYLFSRLKI